MALLICSSAFPESHGSCKNLLALLQNDFIILRLLSLGRQRARDWIHVFLESRLSRVGCWSRRSCNYCRTLRQISNALTQEYLVHGHVFFHFWFLPIFHCLRYFCIYHFDWVEDGLVVFETWSRRLCWAKCRSVGLRPRFRLLLLLFCWRSRLELEFQFGVFLARHSVFQSLIPRELRFWQRELIYTLREPCIGVADVRPRWHIKLDLILRPPETPQGANHRDASILRPRLTQIVSVLRTKRKILVPQRDTLEFTQRWWLGRHLPFLEQWVHAFCVIRGSGLSQNLHLLCSMGIATLVLEISEGLFPG